MQAAPPLPNPVPQAQPIAHAAMPLAPHVDEGSKVKLWINFGLVCLAMVMVSVSILSDSWVVQEQEILGSTIESKIGLDDSTITSCGEDGCDTETTDLSDDYDECKKDVDEWENSAFDMGEYPFKEMCENIGDTATAGLIGTIAFSI